MFDDCMWTISRILSRTAIHLRLLLPTNFCTRPVLIPRTRTFAETNRELLAFARGGVYQAMLVTKHAVRSYRTLSPLPVSRERDHRRSTLCGTSPNLAIKGRWTLSTTVSCRVRTFLAFRTNRNPRPSVHTLYCTPWVHCMHGKSFNHPGRMDCT